MLHTAKPVPLKVYFFSFQTDWNPNWRKKIDTNFLLYLERRQTNKLKQNFSLQWTAFDSSKFPTRQGEAIWCSAIFIVDGCDVNNTHCNRLLFHFWKVRTPWLITCTQWWMLFESLYDTWTYDILSLIYRDIQLFLKTYEKMLEVIDFIWENTEKENACKVKELVVRIW